MTSLALVLDLFARNLRSRTMLPPDTIAVVLAELAGLDRAIVDLEGLAEADIMYPLPKDAAAQADAAVLAALTQMIEPADDLWWTGVTVQAHAELTALDRAEDRSKRAIYARYGRPNGDTPEARACIAELEALRQAQNRRTLAIYARYGGLSRLTPDLRARVEAMLASPR
jgi:hypothetical protein